MTQFSTKEGEEEVDVRAFIWGGGGGGGLCCRNEHVCI